MNIQEQINVTNNLRKTINDFVEHLNEVWYNTEEDMLNCPYRVVSNFSGNWNLEVMYQYMTGSINTSWSYSEAWEDYEDESGFDIPTQWLQWFVDGELEELDKAFLEECEKYSAKLHQEAVHSSKMSLEFLVDEFGKDVVVEMLDSIDKVKL